MKKIVFLVLFLLYMISPVMAQIEIRPEAPPGLGERVELLLGWIYWLAIIATIGMAIYGAVGLVLFGRDTRLTLILALVALAVLIALPEMIKALGV